ncbi:MAG: ATP-binding cassette domain-containing protein, partial [Anaerolineae bacterium]|nr:ATP-binding cassette domain-containing protein [Anaerolineae bacterium]
MMRGNRRRRRNGQNGENGDENENLPNVPMQWQRMIGYLGKYKRRLAVAILATLSSAGLSLVFPAVIQQVVDSALQDRNFELLNQVTLFLLVIFLLRSVTSFFETYNLNYIGERVMVDLRTQLYAHLNTLSLGFFVERRVGELVSRMSSDVTVMRSVLTENVNVILQQTAIMIGSVAIMFVINTRLTLFILALIPILIGLGFVFGFYLQRISTRIQDELAGSTVVMEESLQNIREVKSFVREDYEIGRYNDAINRSFRAALQLLRVNSVFGPFVGFLGFGSIALILWFGGQEVIAERLTGGQLISFLFYGVSVAGSFASLVGLYSSFQKAIGATKRVFQILDTQPTVQDKPTAKTISDVRGELTLKDVNFSYDERQPVLKNINITVAEGEILALVGASGAGKSTTFNLIPRFYDPSSGEILLDGVDLRDITQASLRENIGIVPQETLLFGGTIRENIRYGKLDASEEDIIAAAKAANAHQFITELPDGYETMVGERGTKLSGGLRQRVAIARAILINPRSL